MHEAQQHGRHDSVLKAMLYVLYSTQKLAAHPNLGCLGQLFSIVVVSVELVGGGGMMEGSVQPILVKPPKNPKGRGKAVIPTFGPLAHLTKGQVASAARLPCFVDLVMRSTARQPETRWC